MKTTIPNEPIAATVTRNTTGLTKREFFAALAMQGFCSYEQEHTPTDWEQKWAATAVKVADALIVELNKGIE